MKAVAGVQQKPKTSANPKNYHDLLKGNRLAPRNRAVVVLILRDQSGLAVQGIIAGLPSPGDGVTVSVVDRGFLNVLIHHVDPGNLRCRGETIRHISDSKGNEIVNRPEYVTFSYKKVAGIHRQ